MLHSIQQAFNRRFEVLNNACPFYKIRQQAWKDFKAKGLPTSKNEIYKYTPITNLLTTQFDLEQFTTPLKTTSAVITSLDYHDIDAYHVVICNDRVNDEYTKLSNHEPFMQVLTLHEADRKQQYTFRNHFSRHALSKTDAFIALNTTLFEEGIFIHIANDAIVDKPLMLHYCTTSSTHQPITHPRLLIVAGKNSQASIITSWQTTGFTNAVAEVVLQENAKIDYYNLQTHLDAKSYQVNTTQCYQAQHSILNTYTFTCSGSMVRNNLHSVIDASHSETNMYGLYCLHGQQHVDNCTTMDHRKPHTYSQELYKGIMMGTSTGVFNGRIYVRPEAQKTNAFQTNSNLILSDHATLHTKPQLEIWAEDVKCSHGATIGQLDEAQLFYLRARGLEEGTARSLLCQAFADEVINKVPLSTLRTQLHNRLSSQIGQEII